MASLPLERTEVKFEEKYEFKPETEENTEIKPEALIISDT